MNSNVICFISSKGGSGKTVTCSALGTFLSVLGFRVLMIDTDAATNGMTLLYLDQLLGRKKMTASRDQQAKGLFDLEVVGLPTFIKITDNLDLVPASFVMKDTESADLMVFASTLNYLV